MGKLIFIYGGCRSGKTGLAVSLAQKFRRVAYVATACALDKEMEHRIEKHKQSRPLDWLTIEEPIHIAKALQDLKTKVDVAILDCLTLYLSNLIGKDASYSFDNRNDHNDCYDCNDDYQNDQNDQDDYDDRHNPNDCYDCNDPDDFDYHDYYNIYDKIEKKINRQIEELLDCIKGLDYTLIIIGNELGSGIVPENALARLFRDLNGWINQKIAAQAEDVYKAEVGLGIKIKAACKKSSLLAHLNHVTRTSFGLWSKRP